ncbi:RING-H2 finger protein ATL3K, putative [Ricinus communis]|uniref:RING-H2 finger protein ATL3K, putative n=1 Tax=Ricinus communis TaxID=3988 RepID=B9SBI6_RICCO|nr:RING-H2 finger protein ATL3K, putative [Ricinus communis]|eukprot:XP_002523355.3 putative RING-H2 finger protein ATL21A isoform X1 [Ricinus communis]
MGNLEIFFLLFLLPIIYASEHCAVSKCSNDKVPVRFPFRLEGLQSQQQCGYPGFNLSCNNQRKTVLKLPYSGDFLVRGINYLTQQIQLYDPDNCIPKRLLSFNLSGSPFLAAAHQNYTFLSCPSQLVESRFTTINCLSNSTTSVLATASKSIADSLATSCGVIITLSIPFSWPVQYDEGFSNELMDDLQLTWYSPACEECEQEGGMCGFKTNNSEDVGCFYSSKTGQSTGALQILRVICLSVAVPSIILAGGIVAVALLIDRVPRRNRRTTNQNSATVAVSPLPNIAMVGLDESTIESYEKVVLGESMRLPAGRNDSTCAICLAEYRSKETLRCIPECKHCFHVECIDEWLKMNSSCPVCRNSPSPLHDRSQNV